MRSRLVRSVADIDDVTAAADVLDSKLNHDIITDIWENGAPNLTHQADSSDTNLPTAGGFGPIAERLDQATHEQLTALMRGGIGEPDTLTVTANEARQIVRMLDET